MGKWIAGVVLMALGAFAIYFAEQHLAGSRFGESFTKSLFGDTSPDSLAKGRRALEITGGILALIGVVLLIRANKQRRPG